MDSRKLQDAADLLFEDEFDPSKTHYRTHMQAAQCLAGRDTNKQPYSQEFPHNAPNSQPLRGHYLTLSTSVPSKPLTNMTQPDRVLHGVSANSPLPPSVETAYYRKCIELKRRINEIEENNDTLRVKKARIERAVLKMRIERAMLLESIGNKMKENPDDSDDSNSPPPTVSAILC